MKRAAAAVGKQPTKRQGVEPSPCKDGSGVIITSRNHLLKVEKSALHGWGVFAAERLPPKVILGKYEGEVLPNTEELTKRRAVAEENGYTLEIRGGVLIDGINPCKRNWAALMNTHRGTGKRANVEFTEFGNVRVKGRAIQPGSELLVDYGDDYIYHWLEDSP